MMKLVQRGAGTELDWQSGPEGSRAPGGQRIQATYGLLKFHMARQAQCLGSQTDAWFKLRLVCRIQGGPKGAGDCPRGLQVWARKWPYPLMELRVNPCQSSFALWLLAPSLVWTMKAGRFELIPVCSRNEARCKF